MGPLFVSIVKIVSHAEIKIAMPRYKRVNYFEHKSRYQRISVFNNKQSISDNLSTSSKMHFAGIVAIALATGATAYDLPENLKQIYEKHKVRCLIPFICTLTMFFR